MLIMAKARLPAMPAISVFFSTSSLSLLTMRVPGWSGALVLRMQIGMPTSRTGEMASSCSTEAPMYESSRISA